MFNENDNGNVNLTDEQADATLEIPSVELKDGEDTVQLPAATVKKLIETSKTAIAQKKHWRGKAIDPTSGKPYKELVPAGGSTTVIAPKAEDQATEDRQRIVTLEQAEEKRQFGGAHKLSPGQVDALFAYAKGMGKKPEEMLADNGAKALIQGIASQDRASDARPGPSNRSPVVEGKTFGEMTIEEKRKNFSGVVKSLTGKS